MFLEKLQFEKIILCKLKIKNYFLEKLKFEKIILCKLKNYVFRKVTNCK